jgi:Pentapeptide repeats (8 copies)
MLPYDREPLLERAQLQGADLFGAVLEGANLYLAGLQGAQLHNTDLRGADLDQTMVWRASGKPKVELSKLSNLDWTTRPWEGPGRGSPWWKFQVWRAKIANEIFDSEVREAGPLSWLHEYRGSDAVNVPPPPSVEYGVLQSVAPFSILPRKCWSAAKNRDKGRCENALRINGTPPMETSPETPPIEIAPTTLVLPTNHEIDEMATGVALANFLSDLSCSSDGAPHVARSIIENRWDLGTQSLAVILDRLKKGRWRLAACPGVKGFADEDWATLERRGATEDKKSTSGTIEA